MTTQFKYAISIPLLALTACASPTPPSINAQDVISINAASNRVSALPQTSVLNLPSASATYVGHIGGTVAGDADGSIIGDMSMTVDFAGNTVTGLMDNVNLIDEFDVPEQLLGGSLSISGTETAGQLVATASGSLSAVGDIAVRGSSDVVLTLAGNVRDDTGTGDAVFGNVTGGGIGDFAVTLSGQFYGTSN